MMDKWGTLVGVWQSIFLLISILWQVGGQVLSVSMQSVNSYEGSTATLTCAFTISDPDFTFWNLEWFKGNDPNSDPSSVAISDFFGGATTPTFFNGYDDTSKYRISRDDAASSFEILSTSFNEDDSLYTCRVSARPTTGNYERVTVTAQLTIFILPTSVTLSDSTGVIAPGGTSFLVEGEDHDYTCTVPGINPGASFTWLVVGGGITPGTTTNVTGSNGLITSTGMATLSPAWANHGQTLQCQARNKDGHAGATAGVMLDVKVPPKVSTMSLQDSNDNFLVGSVDVNEGIQKSFTCNAQSRPAAKMEWFLDNNSKSVIDAPTGGGNGLIDTTSDWSLTPARINHKHVVKCEASTAQSDVNSLPAVSVILNVNGPPDDPVITGNTLMTEGVASLLTCTAQEGYPQYWDLVWHNVSSNGDSEIPGSNTNSSSLISDRYTFTSMLSYTPSRYDNEKRIKCTAEWNSWTPQPQVTFGPLNVQFCAGYLNVTQTTKFATAGSTVTLSCETESSNPATNLTWSKDSVQLTTPTDQPNASGDNGGRVTTVIYTTDDLDKTNNGDVYTCCATNPTISSCVTPLCDTHTLNVRYPPDFTSLTPTPQTPVTEGSNVTLTCTVDANPSTVEITWKKNNQVGVLKTTSGLTSTLTLSDIRREDAGNYTCTANNGVPTDNPTDVVSSPITVIVNYEVNITNKEMNEEGVKDGETAVLTCVAVGNPQPVMEWYGPNNTMITSDMDEGKFLITNQTSGGDGVFEFKVTSKLTIKAVDSQVDYGIYTCISSNGIGREDSLNITLTGTRRPDKPTRVEITERTAESLTVGWTPGYDGGETQSFRVSYLKTSDSTVVFTEETDGKTTSIATGLDGYTEYEIRVYAKNSIGESIGYGNTMGYTLPNPPGPGSGITVKYDEQGGTVEVGGLKEGKGCIQLEVQYQGNDTWQECGDCIKSDQTVTLSEWCASSQRRRRRAVGDIEAVQAKTCFNDFCSEPAAVEIVVPLDIGLIVGATVGGVILVAIIVVLVVYLVRTSPKKRSGKEDSFSRANDIQEVELQEPSHDVQPEENNGITNEALQNNDTYAQVNKIKLPPKPQSARSAPTNLPDVTYAEVNRDNKPKPPPDDYAAKKKPKKYVPPSSRAAEESAYEEVQISDKDKAKIPPAAASADTYASVGGQQDTSGRVVTEDGLIYAEVGHMKQHPVDQPPIQTEESTEYASLDFARMKPEDK